MAMTGAEWAVMSHQRLQRHVIDRRRQQQHHQHQQQPHSVGQQRSSRRYTQHHPLQPDSESWQWPTSPPCSPPQLSDLLVNLGYSDDTDIRRIMVTGEAGDAASATSTPIGQSNATDRRQQMGHQAAYGHVERAYVEASGGNSSSNSNYYEQQERDAGTGAPTAAPAGAAVSAVSAVAAAAAAAFVASANSAHAPTTIAADVQYAQSPQDAAYYTTSDSQQQPQQQQNGRYGRQMHYATASDVGGRYALNATSSADIAVDANSNLYSPYGQRHQQPHPAYANATNHHQHDQHQWDTYGVHPHHHAHDHHQHMLAVQQQQQNQHQMAYYHPQHLTSEHPGQHSHHSECNQQHTFVAPPSTAATPYGVSGKDDVGGPPGHTTMVGDTTLPTPAAVIASTAVTTAAAVARATSLAEDGQTTLYHMSTQPPPMSLTDSPNVAGPDALDSPPPVCRRPRGGRKPSRNATSRKRSRARNSNANRTAAVAVGGSTDEADGGIVTDCHASVVRGELTDGGKQTQADRDAHIDSIFIWDLDETIILFMTLLTGTFARAYGKDEKALISLAQEMETLIFDVADVNFFFNDLEECDQVHVDDLLATLGESVAEVDAYDFASDGFRSANQQPQVNAVTDAKRVADLPERQAASAVAQNGITQQQQQLQRADAEPPTGVEDTLSAGLQMTKKLAMRFAKIKTIYTAYRHNVDTLIGQPTKVEAWYAVRHAIEHHTDRWLSLAVHSLAVVAERRNSVNVLVTQTQFVAALAKLLLYGLGPYFEVHDVYSSAKIGKKACFDRIAQRFGRKRSYLVVGDGSDERDAAKQFNWPFWPIASHRDLAALAQATDKNWL